VKINIVNNNEDKYNKLSKIRRPGALTCPSRDPGALACPASSELTIFDRIMLLARPV